MNNSHTLMKLLLVILSLGLSTVSAAQTTPEREANTGSFRIFVPYNEGDQINFGNGASADISSDYGFGMGFSYQQTSQLAWSFDTYWHSAQYLGTRVDEDQQEHRFNSIVDSFDFAVNAEYYFLKGPISPYVHGGLGWSHINSNIPSGPPLTTCWWDPWWGYICDTFVPVHSQSSWSYQAGAGLRADFSKSFYAKLGYQSQWTDIKNAKGDMQRNSIRLELGFNLSKQVGYLF